MEAEEKRKRRTGRCRKKEGKRSGWSRKRGRSERRLCGRGGGREDGVMEEIRWKWTGKGEGGERKDKGGD